MPVLASSSPTKFYGFPTNSGGCPCWVSALIRQLLLDLNTGAGSFLQVDMLLDINACAGSFLQLDRLLGLNACAGSFLQLDRLLDLNASTVSFL